MLLTESLILRQSIIINTLYSMKLFLNFVKRCANQNRHRRLNVAAIINSKRGLESLNPGESIY